MMMMLMMSMMMMTFMGEASDRNSFHSLSEYLMSSAIEEFDVYFQGLSSYR